MKMRQSSPFYFGLFLWYICYLAIPGIILAQTPVRERQVDVITIKPPPGALGREKETIDVREAARNMRNQEMFEKASRALHMVDNAYLSSSTVSLLRTALNDSSDEVRRNAIILLGISRNPEAIEIISNHLQNDPSSRVRWTSAVKLGMLAGEEAIPALKVALTEDKRITPAVIYGLGYAGGTAVPILLQMLEDPACILYCFKFT